MTQVFGPGAKVEEVYDPFDDRCLSDGLVPMALADRHVFKSVLAAPRPSPTRQLGTSTCFKATQPNYRCKVDRLAGALARRRSASASASGRMAFTVPATSQRCPSAFYESPNAARTNAMRLSHSSRVLGISRSSSRSLWME